MWIKYVWKEALQCVVRPLGGSTAPFCSLYFILDVCGPVKQKEMSDESDFFTATFHLLLVKTTEGISGVSVTPGDQKVERKLRNAEVFLVFALVLTSQRGSCRLPTSTCLPCLSSTRSSSRAYCRCIFLFCCLWIPAFEMKIN